MKICDPDEIALKTFFLGPQAENSSWVLEEINVLFKHWFDWRKSVFPEDGRAISEGDIKTREYRSNQTKFRDRLHELMIRYEQEVPKFSPRHMGHMVSETSLPALLGHIVTLLHNPNNISGEVSKVGAQVEAESVAFLAKMLGFKGERFWGHFTSGGTVANIEALWRARYRLDHWLSLGAYERKKLNSTESLFDSALRGWGDYREKFELANVDDEELRTYSFVANSPWAAGRQIEKSFGCEFKGPVVLIPNNKHYSWQKGVSLLGLGERSFWSIELNRFGKLCVRDLKNKIKKAHRENRPVLMVVSVAGTTELGEVDPVHEVQDLLDSLKRERGWDLWHHVDAAYGGFFCSMLGDVNTESVVDEEDLKALNAMGRVNSVTIDPHKLGYVPYSCGALIVHDVNDYETSSFSAPYVNQKEQNLWQKTLEGSRSAAGATATWLTAMSVGLNSKGYGRILKRSFQAKIQLESLLREKVRDSYFVPGCSTNISCFCVARRGEKVSETNFRMERLYEQLPQEGPFYVSRTVLDFKNYGKLLEDFVGEWQGERDIDSVVVLRLVLMNPFFTSRETTTSFPDRFVDKVLLLTEN